MLLGFQVTNHRSFLDRVDFSMIAVDEDREAARGFERLSEQVLTVAGIYGPNASGKSNLLDGIAWLSTAVRTSFRGWDEFIPREPHLMGDGPSKPSVFDMSLVVEGIEYEYRLVVDDSAVLYESLHGYPEGRRRRFYVRDGDDLRFARGLGGARGVQDLLTSTVLVLSAATRLRVPVIHDVGRAISGIGTLGVRSWMPPFSSLFNTTRRLFTEQGEYSQLALFADMATDRDVALELLRWADPGIVDVDLVEQDASEGQPGRPDALIPRRHCQFVRRIADEDYLINYGDESAGTQTWFRLLGPAFSALRRGRVLLFDEIDASLHPRLSSQLIQLFQDPESNPRNAQLIFTTHDTSLLNVLNRDEVWLTEKGTAGASQLVALAEYRGERVRKSLNLERAYLQGRFGAIPEADQITIRNALGLALGES